MISNSKILTLDLSTTSTGYAIFSKDDKVLLRYGCVKPSIKKASTYTYPTLQLLKMKSISSQIIDIIKEYEDLLDSIIIEEINRGKNRLGQKTLDGLHYILMDYLWGADLLHLVQYYDSDGAIGWRSKTGLGLQLSSTDRLVNKERRKVNKKINKGQKKQSLITQKTLACAFVNKYYNLELKENLAGGADIADAIGLGHFYLYKVLING